MKKIIAFKEWFTDFLIYNLVFFFLQILYIASSEASFIHAISYPIMAYWQIAIAFFIQIILYILLSGLQTILLWGIACTLSNNKPSIKKYLVRGQLFIYFISIAALISINCYFFPLSRFSRIFLPNIPSIIFTNIMIITCFCLIVLALLAIWQYMRCYPLRVAGLLVILLGVLRIPVTPSPLFQSHTKPNLLMISIDSLGPEQINDELTPNIAHFLNESSHFTDTISPLARTYPAWTSILTGLYPLHHHARENLYPAWRVEHNASFAWNLQRMGYRTLFASDERRFNNLGSEFGFQEIIGPRIGITDILLGSFYDFPLSNLLINMRISHWLLPSNYSNRAGFFSYYPTTFDQSLYQGLAKGNHTKPLFLAVHFSLPHWPYVWANSSPAKVNDEYNIYHRQALYYEAIHRADQQVGDLLQYLQQQGALTNSVVILLSDHGEVLYKKGSRKTSPKTYQGSLATSEFVNYLKRKTMTPLEKSVGHGSDLLSPAQYHCLLGIKIIQKGNLITKPQTINTRVALIDIAPTIADLFHFKLAIKSDGISLKDTIIQQSEPINRFIMLESGMLANQSLTRDKLISYAQTLFTVNPNNNLLEIRKDQFSQLNAQKLYGIIYKSWLIALYPDDKYYVTVLLNLKTGLWTDKPDSSFALNSPFKLMLKTLRQFYKSELANYPAVP